MDSSRKNAQCDDPEVRAILDAGAGIESPAWIYNEFADVNLGDKRLDKRLIRTAGFLGSAPLSPINQACLDWRSVKAAYRMFDNPKATPASIRAPHIAATVRRMVAVAAEGTRTVLVASDTAFISYTHPKVTGIGPVGKSNDDGRGLVMHSGLVMTTEGVPLGLLHQNIWARDDVPEEGRQEKIERLQQTPIEAKESFKWLCASREAHQHTPPGCKVVMLCDREGDVYEHIVDLMEHKGSYVIRARSDRRLVPEDNDGSEQMHEALAAAEELGTMEVKVPGNGKRKTRIATVGIKVAQVTIKAPQRRGPAKDSCSSEAVTVTLVGATEISSPPEGEAAISWVLLTNLLVPDFEAGKEKVLWYSYRFGIETFHRVLKSGLKVEDCRLETGERLARHLALCSVIAVRMMNVAYLAREKPQLPASTAFSEAELEAMHVLTREGPPPKQPPTLKEAVRMVAKIGGHLGRKRDAEPGMTVMWRGWLQLYIAARVVSRMRRAGMVNSS
ncbi:MAG: IS4 family transposase [Steroidobacteraceae bacterium]